MCKIIDELSKVKTGYKIVAVKNGKIYSIFTRQEYKTGKVPSPPRKQVPLSSGFKKSTIFKNADYYNQNFAGKTALFISKKSALDFKNMYDVFSKWVDGYDIKVAKISFRNDVYKGSHAIDVLGCFDYRDIIAGDTIRSIEIIN